MTTHIALLRAVNVGGTGKLPMAELREMCAELGFKNVRTYIASGNLVLESPLASGDVKQKLEARLTDYAGKPQTVLMRSLPEMEQILADNPFPNGAPNRVLVTFLDAAPPSDALETVTHRKDEEIALGNREIYVHYGEGMGQSKLKIPAAAKGTARNINTVRKLIEMAGS